MTTFLKEIVVENFKSFKDVTTIGPLHPFNGVIGPNGSGKSNFMDAISFAMGEKTSKLRVKRLNDLIHGADIGKPVANSASVTAIFQEKAGNWTSFKRSVVNSSSEHRINNILVTSQTYLDELHRLGINAKANNFLVFQGSVEEIALMDSDALRSLLEEISTSVILKPEYERLRAEQLQAEKATQFAFLKKKGMAADRKEAQMEKQEAQKFRRLRNEYVRKNVELQLFRLFHIEKKVRNLQAEHEAKRQELESVEAEVEAEEAAFGERKKAFGVQTRELAKMEQNLREVEAAATKKKPQFIKTKENVAHLQRKVETAEKLRGQARQADDALKKEIAELENELAKIEEAKATFEASVDGPSPVAETRSVTLEAEQIREYNRLKEKASNESAQHLQHLDSIIREQKSEQDKLDNELRKKTEIEDKMKQKVHLQQETEKRRDRLEEFAKTSITVLEDLQKNRAELQIVVGGSQERVENIQRELENITAELGDATVDRHELLRIRKKTEVVENLREIYPGVFDRILNLCKPSHKRYNVAVAKVLGRNMDAIVVDTEKTARECIKYLKAGLLEPETFLPLDYIRPRPLKERLRMIREPRNVKLLYDVLNFFPKNVERAVLYVTRNTLVCETAEDANIVAYEMDPNSRYDCVALDGTFFQRSGIISGGTLDIQRRAKQWDEKQMAELKLRKGKLTEQLQDALMTSRREFELKNVELKIKGLETQLRYSNADLAEAKTNLEVLRTELENLRSEREKLEPTISAIRESMAERDKEIHRVKETVNSLEDRIFEDFCKQIGVPDIRRYEERELLTQQERDRRRMDFENQCNRIVTQLEFEKKRDTQSNILRWEKAVQEAETKLAAAKEAESNLRAEMEADDAKLRELEAAVKAKKAEIKEQEEELAQWRNTLKTLGKEILKVQRSINAIEADIEKKKSERHAILMKCKMEDVAIPIIEGNIEDMPSGSESTSGSVETSQQQHQREDEIIIDYSELSDELKDLEESADLEKVVGNMKKTMKDLNSSIEQIPAPNMKADEKLSLVAAKFQETRGEFEETCRKVRKISAQFDKVKNERYRRFMLSFEHVANAIDDIYKGLVQNRSAQAYLEAENPEEPYLGGITFNCIAPGKRFQTMANLSGGEKTVAALALLFAINSLQPAPFFVLDEIDAALDNENIGKVASYIRMKSSAIQIIVISLKLEFYSKADALVGISPDTGECLESQVFTLNLTEYAP